MLARRRTEMHAAPVGTRREGDQSEVPRLDGLGHVVAPEATPANEVLLGNEDSAVVPRPAARAACEAVELHAPYPALPAERRARGTRDMALCTAAVSACEARRSSCSASAPW